eukprot:CAMPEP_0170641578 /NCGR_PEP_ID=MMETSP0224-20130122/40854_1 /TAXON_ID=285029 /ORGANISM="Togula jolla, Strain CCCM 725" /LENGTH=47 /DNA_ID= /DNA_START= /DNA_END= /DNA_ORIENTATION=
MPSISWITFWTGVTSVRAAPALLTAASSARDDAKTAFIARRGSAICL